MAAISWQGFTGFVRQIVAGVQAQAAAAVDASEGSITLALAQAVTGVALWLQALIAQVLKLTRAATSDGTDLDSWMADWSFTRLPAVAATGYVTFSRYTPTQQAVVLIGAVVQTGPNGQQFAVTLDPANGAYSAQSGGYVLAANTASVTVPVAALTAGAGGNVLASTITSFVQPIVGVDTVTNASPFINGADAEGDAAFRARFWDYIVAIRRATSAAIRAAITGVQQNLVCVIIENQDTDGTPDNGFLTIVVDDGTGAPPSGVLNQAASAVEKARGAGIRYGVIAPSVTNVTIVLTAISIDTSQHAVDATAAQNAILAYVNALPIGATLVWSRLFQIAFDASDNIAEIGNLVINSMAADVAVAATSIIKTTSVTVS